MSRVLSIRLAGRASREVRRVLPYSYVVRYILIATVYSSLVVSTSVAQQAQTVETLPDDQSTSGQEFTSEGPPISFVRRSMEVAVPSLGLSLGERVSYGSEGDTLVGSLKPQAFASIRARLFSRIPGRRSEFHWEYALRYNRGRDFGDTQHFAQISFAHRISPRVSVEVTDIFDSGTNHYPALTEAAPSFVTEVPQSPDVVTQGITRNSIIASFDFRVGPRSAIDINVGHSIFRYDTTNGQDNQGFQVGVGSEFQINQWLFLNNQYSTYLNRASEANSTVDIHELEFGGLEFRSRSGFGLSVGASLELADEQELGYTAGAGANVGISKISESTALSLSYHRGLSPVAGTGSVFNGHGVTASVTQWMSRRVNVNATGQYTRGVSRSGGRAEYLLVSGQLQTAVHNHLLFSIDYSYASQVSVFGVGEPAMSRYTIGAGFDYSLPSLLGP